MCSAERGKSIKINSFTTTIKIEILINQIPSNRSHLDLSCLNSDINLGKDLADVCGIKHRFASF